MITKSQLKDAIYHIDSSWYLGDRSGFLHSENEPATGILKKNYAAIKTEILNNFDATLIHLKTNYTPYSADTSGWKSINFYTYFLKYPDNCKKFPVINSIVNQIPNKCMAMISVLEPGAKIAPHIGDTDGIDRHHLGIKIPSEDSSLVGLQIKRETRHWSEGEVLSFCNMHRHRAWNLTNEYRVVLIVDTIRSDLISKQYDVAAKTLAVIAMKHIARQTPALKSIPKWLIRTIHTIFAATFKLILFIERKIGIHFMAITGRDN